jgi:hypothetical protein
MNKRRKGRKTRERVEGAALLLAFIEKHDIPYRTASEQLGVEHPAVWQWAHAITVPLERYRPDIATWTSGAVPEGSWLRKAEREERAVDVRPFKPSGTEA